MKTVVKKGDNKQIGKVATETATDNTTLKVVGNDLDNSATEEKTEEVKPAEESKKEEISAMIEKFRPEPIVTAEARIERMKHFEALSNRFGALKEKSSELKTFKAGNDKMNAKITFQNAQGYKLEVQNSGVIQKLVEAAESELNVLLLEAENEVVTFEI